MSDFAVAIGLALALEGLLYALFPAAMKRMAARALEIPGDTLRLMGALSLASGVGIVWMIRG